MRLFQVPEDGALAALRALKVVALANGELADNERILLEIAATLYGVAADMTSWRLKDDRSAFDPEEIRIGK